MLDAPGFPLALRASGMTVWSERAEVMDDGPENPLSLDFPAPQRLETRSRLEDSSRGPAGTSGSHREIPS